MSQVTVSEREQSKLTERLDLAIPVLIVKEELTKMLVKEHK